jgi:hypothetical protein
LLYSGESGGGTAYAYMVPLFLVNFFRGIRWRDSKCLYDIVGIDICAFSCDNWFDLFWREGQRSRI